MLKICWQKIKVHTIYLISNQDREVLLYASELIVLSSCTNGWYFIILESILHKSFLYIWIKMKHILILTPHSLIKLGEFVKWSAASDIWKLYSV